MNEGYILLFRSLFENEFLYGDGHKFTKPEMWIWMLTYARWQDSPRTFTIRGNKVTVNRGELAESVRTLCEVWNWSNKSVIKVLNEFEAEGMIEIERSTVINKIRIVNYDKFQFNFTQRITQQPTQQNEPYIYGGLKEIEQIATQQITQQNTQQITQPFNKCLNKEEINNTSSSLTREENFFSELGKTDTEFFTLVCMRLNIDSEAYKTLLQDFIQECKMRDKWHLSMQDAKNHFVDWSRKELERRNKPKQQNNGVQAKYDPTGSYEPKSTREDYFL